MPRLFVYGTLRVGELNYSLLENSRIIEENKIISGYELRVNHSYYYIYPYAFFSPGKNIIGDVFEVKKELMIRELDGIEDTSTGYYTRHFDKTHNFYIYVKGKDDRENFPLIESGDWKVYRENYFKEKGE